MEVTKELLLDWLLIGLMRHDLVPELNLKRLSEGLLDH